MSLYMRACQCGLPPSDPPSSIGPNLKPSHGICLFTTMTQTESLICRVGCHGASQDYGVDHYLCDSLFDDPSFPVKKLHHKTLSHLFSEWMTLVGTKDNMHTAIKPPNKIWHMLYKECIKLLTFTKYQKTHKESNWGSKECLKQQNTESV
jgi:hypothetical protein